MYIEYNYKKAKVPFLEIWLPYFCKEIKFNELKIGEYFVEDKSVYINKYSPHFKNRERQINTNVQIDIDCIENINREIPFIQNLETIYLNGTNKQLSKELKIS